MLGLTQRHERILKVAVLTVLVLVAVILFITKLAVYVAPFILALLITFTIEKPVRLLQKKAKLPRSLAVAIVLTLFVLIVGGLLILVFYQIVVEMWRLTKEIDIPSIQGFIDSLIVQSQDLYHSLPEEIAQYIENNLGTLEENLGALLSTIITWLENFVRYLLDVIIALPQVFIFIVISLVATFFMSRDRVRISQFLFAQLPKDWVAKIRSIKGDLFHALVGFVKAQLILITVTFVELLIGYWILGVRYTFFFALLTALVDALPVLGTGTVLIPVAAVHLIMGNIPRAFSFVVLYIIILAVRQFLEPKVVGGSLGLHPLVTLITIYLGLQLFGLAGLLLGPLVVIVIKAVQNAGILPKWKT